MLHQTSASRHDPFTFSAMNLQNMNPVKPKHKPDIIVKGIGREAILYRSTQEGIHVLNPTARVIWDLCDGEHTLEEIELALRAKFSISPDHNVKLDIQKILGTFAAKELLIDKTVGQ